MYIWYVFNVILPGRSVESEAWMSDCVADLINAIVVFTVSSWGNGKRIGQNIHWSKFIFWDLLCINLLALFRCRIVFVIEKCWCNGIRCLSVVFSRFFVTIYHIYSEVKDWSERLFVNRLLQSKWSMFSSSSKDMF